MKVKCKLSIGKKRIRTAIIDINDAELAGKNEDARIEVIDRYFHAWLWNTINADWEVEDS